MIQEGEGIWACRAWPFIKELDRREPSAPVMVMGGTLWAGLGALGCVGLWMLDWAHVRDAAWRTDVF